MVRRQGRFWDRQTLVLVPLVLVALTAVVMSSCSGSGGGSDGELCDQCGDDPDGPCVPEVEVQREPDAPPPCNVPSDDPNPCTVQLICRRKVDSAQRRCYPKDPERNDVNYQFRCDGSRPGGTPGPQPTVTFTPSPQPTSNAVCGNGDVEDGEECDGTDLNGQSCAELGCDPPGGTLSCRVNGTPDECTFNTSQCSGLCPQ